MDEQELLRGDAPFVADTSAWWRVASLPSDLGVLVYSACSSTEYVALELELDALRILRNDRAVADAAMGALRDLAERSDGYHRVPLTDALIAAAAAEHGGLVVLHRDAHFDRLAEVLAFRSVELSAA